MSYVKLPDNLSIPFTFLDNVKSFFKKSLYFVSKTEELTVKIPFKYFNHLVLFLSRHTAYQFKVLVDLSLLDYAQNRERLYVFVSLLSLRFNARLTVVSSLTEGLFLNSITNVFSGAAWYEREAWDMFGIYFDNNRDLRRILTDYGFKGHPLLKEFPMTGFVEVIFDYFFSRIFYQAVTLVQEYRVWSYSGSYSKFSGISSV